MSNLIPGNQKHLTLDDRKFIENSLNEGLSFKGLPNIFARIRPPSQRRFVFTGLMTFNQNGYLIIHITFALRDLGANGQMYVKRLFSVILNVHHATNVIRYATLL
ncbi:MAG: hypothetical protein ACLUR5_16890 [Eubacterium ventriosum]